ncbi:MAG TPA: nickel pincer cofactor biosynthesis protein LarC [Desulfobacteraceae bacterium]|nr:nickel pincer cofactor biosynthesis protein LarC [Desulfobacteraceae bacterium]|tara:strand:+ start:812 stop:2038 length:1227 start_codon:yes stop_codon:yes gene_type:complete
MILYLDLVSGIAGDMALGALVDLGVPLDWLEKKLSRILTGFSLRTQIVFPQHLRAVNLHVDVTDDTAHRHYTDIRGMINTADLPEPVRRNALTAFRKIAEAEAHIHGKDIDHVHFHEIGGIDSLVDIIGTFLALDYLGVTRVTASKIPLGSGVIDCAHGKIPVPVPATLAILKGLPVTQSDAKTEIVTPTGAAIVATLAEDFGPMPEMEISGIGYGAGKRDTGALAPNIIRMVLGKPAAEEQSYIRRDRVMEIRTNVDDTPPEILGFTMDRLMDAGALDVTFTPVVMKKNRPATRIEVICREKDLDPLAHIILTETTAIGLRYSPCDRMILQREATVLDLGRGMGKIEVKQVTGPNGRKRLAPEYDACRKKAEELKVPLWDIYERVISLGNALDSGQARLYKTNEGKS